MPFDRILVSLGDGNAENERQLPETFIRTGDYQRVESNLRSLVFGGRGAGKSAICRMLESVGADPAPSPRQRTHWAVSLSSDTASWRSLERAARTLDDDAQWISRQWELTILLQCFEVAMKELPRTARRRQLVSQLDDEITKLLDRETLKSVNEGRLSYIVDTAVKILQRLPFRFVVSAPFVPIGIEIREPSESRNEPRLTVEESERRRIAVVESMYGVLKQLIPTDTTIRVLIDQLDDDWKARKQQIESLVGLFSAVMRMHGNLTRLELVDRIRVVVFLRTDIYEFLKQNGLDDATKFAQHELHLRWDVESLRRMLDRRIEAAGEPRLDSLRSLFSDERIGQRSLDEHLLALVAPRPRDVIHFLQACIDNALNRGHERISKTDVEDATSRYSLWRRQVIIEEARYGFSELEAALNSFVSKTADYTPQELMRHLDTFKRDSDVRTTKPKLIAALVDWGVLGVQGKNKKPRFVWDLPEGQWIGPDASGGESWVIHQALWKALSITRKRPLAKAST